VIAEIKKKWIAISMSYWLPGIPNYCILQTPISSGTVFYFIYRGARKCKERYM